MRDARRWIALTAFGCLLSVPTVARAYLGYNFIEFGGAPIFNSPVKIKVIDDSTKFTGEGFGGGFSFALHPNWHVRMTGTTTTARSGTVRGLPDPETSEPRLEGKLKTDTVQITVIPTFNYRIATDTDLNLSLGAVWGKRDFKLNLRDSRDREEVLEGALNDEEWGVIGGAGVRSMLWRGLEGFGNFNVSSVALLENEIFFNLGLRYHFQKVAALAAQLQVSTDSFVGLWMGLRVHYDQLYDRLAD